MRRWLNLRRMSATDGITLGPDAVHDHVGVALEQGHHAGDPVEDLALLGRAEDLDQVAAAADRLGDPLEAVVEQAVRLDGVGDGLHLGEEVVAHPRDRGELHPVGLLVQADPEPEVGRVAPRARARRGRCWGPPAAAGRTGSWNGSNWPSTLPARKPSSRPTSAPVTLEPTARDSPDGAPFFSVSLSTIGPRTVAKPSALACTQPGPVDHEDRRGAVGGDEPGEVTDQPGREVGVAAQLLDGGVGLGAAHGRPVAGHPGPQRDGEVPVDHLAAHVGDPTRGGQRHASEQRAVAGQGGGEVVQRGPGVEGVDQVDPVGQHREDQVGAAQLGRRRRPGRSPR